MEFYEFGNRRSVTVKEQRFLIRRMDACGNCTSGVGGSSGVTTAEDAPHKGHVHAAMTNGNIDSTEGLVREKQTSIRNGNGGDYVRI